MLKYTTEKLEVQDQAMVSGCQEIFSKIVTAVFDYERFMKDTQRSAKIERLTCICCNWGTGESLEGRSQWTVLDHL